MLLEGRFTLITGAGAGIGRALAIEAARRGMIVALAGRRAERLEETRAHLPSAKDCLTLPGDVISPLSRRAIIDQVARQWGQLHVLVNNAGVITAGPLATIQDDDIGRLISTNLSAPITMVRDTLPLLRAGAPARIVNIGSMLGDIALPLFAAYSASKFGLRGLSNAMRREFKSLGIGVTYAAPRGAQTDATKAIAHFVEPMEIPLDSPEAIARQIWDAVDQGRDTVYPKGRERLFLTLERLFPSLVSHALRKQSDANGVRRLIEDATASAPASVHKPWSTPGEI